MTHFEHQYNESLGAKFHTYGLYWDDKELYTYLDDPANKMLQVDFTKQSFF